jgi:tetratricopeptide (TPR) repeat protein
VRRASLVGPLAAALAVAGCAYYNSMYQAVHIARRADKAERQGRSFDAQGFWGQVAVEAETTIARHPRSKWYLPARFLQGKAYQRLGACDRAIGPLEVVQGQSRDSVTVEQARILLAGCYSTLGDVASAASTYRMLLGASDTAVRREALYAVGLGALAGGDPAEALADLTRSGDPRAAAPRARALAQLRRTAEAAALADSLITARDSTVPWDSLFDAVGAADPATASRLVDHRVADTTLKAEARATLVVADGVRLLGSDTARAVARLVQGAELAPTSEAAREAAVRIAAIHAARAVDAGELDSALAALDLFGRTSPTSAFQVAGEVDRVRWLRNELDSLRPALPEGDMRAFLAAEFARDSVGAPALARRLFLEIATEAPASPYAPKAVLAAIALDPAAGDSLRAAVASRYPASPYLLALTGGASADFARLEDSLFNYALAHPRTRRPPPRRSRDDQL